MANYNSIPMCSALRLQRTPTDTMVLSLTRWVETENSKKKQSFLLSTMTPMWKNSYSEKSCGKINLHPFSFDAAGPPCIYSHRQLLTIKYNTIDRNH